MYRARGGRGVQRGGQGVSRGPRDIGGVAGTDVQGERGPTCRGGCGDEECGAGCLPVQYRDEIVDDAGCLTRRMLI